MKTWRMLKYLRPALSRIKRMLAEPSGVVSPLLAFFFLAVNLIVS